MNIQLLIRRSCLAHKNYFPAVIPFMSFSLIISNKLHDRYSYDVTDNYYTIWLNEKESIPSRIDL